jgi:hypothetical protein
MNSFQLHRDFFSFVAEGARLYRGGQVIDSRLSLDSMTLRREDL